MLRWLLPPDLIDLGDNRRRERRKGRKFSDASKIPLI